MKDLTKHLSHYMALFGVLLAGFAGLVIFSYDKNESFEEIKKPNGIKKSVIEIDINGNIIKKYNI